MELTLDELVEKYNAGTMTDAELKESGYMIHQVENLAEELKNGKKKGEDKMFEPSKRKSSMPPEPTKIKRMK